MSNYLNKEKESMLNSFAKRLFGSQENRPTEFGENINEEFDSLIDDKNKSKLKKRFKKNKLNKKKKYE